MAEGIGLEHVEIRVQGFRVYGLGSGGGYCLGFWL